MFDEDGNRKDKFPTKPCDKGPKNYIVRAMAFSPNSDKLAIAQTDNMVFVYKLGTEWGEKKSICNKFQHSSPVTCLVWPEKRPNEIYYGLAEGKVKVGQMKTHKPVSLYESTSYVTAMSISPSGASIASCHADGSIYTYWFDNPDRGARMIVRHNCAPFAMTWAGSIVVAGCDNQVVFYDEDGGEESVFDYGKERTCKEFTCAISNPTGDAVVLGNFDSFYVYNRNIDTLMWEEKSITRVENMYSVTAMDWKSDGGRVALGSVRGIVDLYDVCVRKSVYKGGFEMTYVSHSQVIVRKVDTNARIVVRSNYGLEIVRTNIYKSRYVVATTNETLLVGDIESLRMSEVQWHGNGKEKFIFENPAACIIFYAGEVSIVEYGFNEILGAVRTSYTSSHVLSLRINERPPRPSHGNADGYRNPVENKKVAFLLDAQTVCIKDLTTQSSVSVFHDAKVDWLELNTRADLLLFRDKRRHLHLYAIENQTRTQLLNFCTYVQWVPNSDVVVAQNRSSLCVWYNISAPDQVTLHSIKGDVEDIERGEGRTEVIVDEGMTQAVYPLDESLIEFGGAMEDRDLFRAMEILEHLEITPESEAMWKQLGTTALEIGDLAIAQRCEIATGDVATSKYLGDILDAKMRAEMQTHGMRGEDHYLVRSKMALLVKDLKGAEEELLSQGKVQECIDMYQSLLKDESAIRVAEENRHPNAMDMRQSHFQRLLDSNQELQAAMLKEKESDHLQAINLYLKAGAPGKAAKVVIENDLRQPVPLIESIASALTRAGIHDKAGEFYERLDELQRALDSYIRGNAYRRAVELARRSFPGRVVELQEQWGDYLVSQKQVDMAINHYIEAKVSKKAIEAALNARQYPRALQLIDAIDSETSRPYYRQLAKHYETSGQYDLAERCYVSGDQAHLAVEMHTTLGNWEVAYKLATSYMSEGEVGLLYINQAQRLESQGKLREAEKLYLTVKERDLAINMYKKNRRYDDMIRLVTEFRPDLLKDTHQFLAQNLEVEGALKEAEHHYVEAQEWHSAVNMYRSSEMWDDAIRVAKFYGGINACKRVTIALLTALGIPDGSKYLLKHGLVDAAIEHAAESGAFDMAFDLANTNNPKKLPEIHLKHALFLEDDERFAEAEEAFVKANKPREAIDMYVHQQDWTSACRVAETFDPTSVADVYIAHAKAKIEGGDYKAAEELLLTVSRPDLALMAYQDADNWQDAQRVAQLHLPHKVAEVTKAYQAAQARGGKGSSRSDFISTGRAYEKSKNWTQAIETYMAATKARIESPAELEDIWGRAVEVARNNVPNRYVEITLEVSRRLVEIKREETAADILFEIGRHDEAIGVCLNGGKFDKAKSLAQGNVSLQRRVDDAYQNHLVSANNHTELLAGGRTDVALDVLAKRSDWERLWEVVATEQPPQSEIAKYALMNAEELIDAKGTHLDEAAKLLQAQPGPATEAAMPVYRRLVRCLMMRSKDAENAPGVDHAGAVAALREVLYRLGSRKQEVEELLMATHYQHMYFQAKQLGLPDVAAKCAITLLKYPSIIPHDKAFFQAGEACKELGITNLAFVLLNRYIDLTEAIDTGDATFMDSSDYHEADAIPLNAPIPSSHYLALEDDREDVRTWVLSIITDSSIDQRIPPRDQSRGTLYEAFFSVDRPTCIVTGYPVYPADMLEVNNSVANRKDWNAMVSKTRSCPWTGQDQNPLY